MRKKTDSANLRSRTKRRPQMRGYATRCGLILHERRGIIHLPEADSVAIAFGFTCAEEMVRELERRERAKRPTLAQAVAYLDKNKKARDFFIEPDDMARARRLAALKAKP